MGRKDARARNRQLSVAPSAHPAAVSLPGADLRSVSCSRTAGAAVPAARTAPTRPDATEPGHGRRALAVESFRSLVRHVEWCALAFTRSVRPSQADPLIVYSWRAPSAGHPSILALFRFPCPTTSSSATSSHSRDPDSEPATTDSVREPRTLERCRLHTVMLFTPASPSATAGAASPAENGGSGPSPQAASGIVRDFAWQPLASSAGADVDFAEEIVGAAQSEGSGEEEEVLVVATGQKGFAMWRAPRVDADGTADDGIAECVGIPARESG